MSLGGKRRLNRVRLLRGAAVVTFALSGLAAGAIAAATPVYACNIAPGTANCAPDTLTISSTSTLVASKTTTVTSCPLAPACFTATYTEEVWRDPATNIYGCAGCLDWLITVSSSSSSTDPIARVTISNFQGFLTDIGRLTGSPPSGSTLTAGTLSPNNVSRDGSGGILAWDFTLPTNEITAGTKSVILEVVTNSRLTVPGTISFQDASTASSPAFGPTVPEAWVPALGLVGAAVLGGAAFRQRRRKLA